VSGRKEMHFSVVGIYQSMPRICTATGDMKGYAV